MSLIAVIGTATLFLKGNRLLAWAWAAAAAGGAILDYLLKTTIHRSRPEYAASFLHGSSYSFPSGHAMGSVIGYGFLAYAVVITSQRRGWQRGIVIGVAAVLALLIGLSRVYLGVHYPSDVAGGWAAGLVWLAVCVTGYRVVAGRRAFRSSNLQSGVA
jgi:undecaprenyl-diphosphatase